VRGYDNRVKLGKYSPDSGWERVDQEKFIEVEQLVNKMKRWDRSTMDVSNKLGMVTFLVVGSVIGLFALIGFGDGRPRFQILAVDAALLLLPHWITGTRSILDQPNLLLKIHLIQNLLQEMAPRLQRHRVELYMLLKGKQTKIPDDVKFRVNIHNQHSDFLGFYGQAAINTVKGKGYPYFYTVLVAKQGYGLRQAFTAYAPSRGIKKEFKVEGEVEVLVIRRSSGYHTKPKMVRQLFLEGLEIAETVAVK
jgi:hypothetical protein